MTARESVTRYCRVELNVCRSLLIHVLLVALVYKRLAPY